MKRSFASAAVRKLLVTVTTLSLVVGMAGSTRATGPLASGAEQGPMAKRIDATSNNSVDELLVAGFSVAVSREGRIVFDRGYGRSNVERGTVVRADTIFRTGSVGKQFIAAVLVKQAQDGKLSLDEPVTKFLPEYPEFRGITVRQLLNHTAGLPTVDTIPEFEKTQGVGMSQKEVLRLIAEQPREFDPGSRWRYSNSGYLVAGAVVEKLTGVHSSTYAVEHALRPLGLQDTSDCGPQMDRERSATGYDVQDQAGWSRVVRLGRPPMLTTPRNINLRIVSSAGGFCSTSAELVKWTDALHGGAVLDPSSLEQMTSPTKLPGGSLVPYGLGLQMRKFGNHPAIGHSGIIWGFNSIVATFPEDDVTVALMVNTLLPSQEVEQLWNRLLSAVFDESGSTWKDPEYAQESGS
jgi:D-alanyl-D-alanine carboxypeptidase